MANELDDLSLETRTGGAGDIFILSPGKHAVEIASIDLEEQQAFGGEGMEKRLKFTFKTVKPLGPEGAEEYGEEAIGKHGIISAWPRLTAYDLGENTRSALTILIDSLFGRKLTQDEAQRLAISKLVGIKGFVIVGTSQSGKSRFDSFLLPKNKPVPEVAQYLKPEGAGAVRGRAPKPKVEEEELHDPFADED
jgi:hypothetical protein